jgi:tetratricopeptide (TPR) repeat protein
MPDQIFISYRRDDAAYVTGHINDRLRKEFGYESIFTDVDRIELGVDFRTTLDQMVSECQILLAVIGEDWLTVKDQEGQLRLQDPADFVRIEIESALQRNIPVIPLLVAGVDMPSKDDLPDSLQDLAFRNGTQIRPEPDFHTDMDRLINSLNKHLQTLPKETKDEKRGHSASEAGRRDEQELGRSLTEVKLTNEPNKKRRGFSEANVKLENEEIARKHIELQTGLRTKKRWAAFVFRPLVVVGILFLAGGSWYIVVQYQEQVQATNAALAAIQKATADAEAKLQDDADAEAKLKADADAEAKLKADADAEAKLMADAVAETKRKAEAIAQAKRNADASALISEGVSLAALGDHKAAIRNYDEAIRMNAEDANAYYNRSASHYALGDFIAASKDCDEAIRFKPEFANTYCNWGASQ